MKHAPFLLQAFAARVLASKSQATVSRAELEQQGYDVQTLCEMIEAYGALSEGDRGFVVTATPTHILIERKPDTAAPFPPKGVSALPPPAAVPAKTPPTSALKSTTGFKLSSGRTGTQ